MIHVAFCNIQCLQVLVYMSLHMIAVHLVMEVSYPGLPPNHPVMDDYDFSFEPASDLGSPMT